MIQGIRDLWQVKELRNRILFTLGALAVYRLGAAIPCPGIDPAALREFFERQQNTLWGFLDMFAGGALNQMSVFAMGIMPYITASIMFSILRKAMPAVEKIAREGEAGQRKITQITRYATVVIGAWQAFGLTAFLAAMQSPVTGQPAVPEPTLGWRLQTILTMVAGTIFVMWLGEQISEKGVGNGISLMIFAGIIERLPTAIKNLFVLVRTEEISLFRALIIAAVAVAIVAAVVWIETAQRRIEVQYGKRIVGRRMTAGATSFLPIKVDQSGVVAVIFAVTVLQLPAQASLWFPSLPLLKWAQNFWTRGSAWHDLLYVALIIFFCYLYNSIILDPNDIAENLQKWGGSIPGIRAGEPTADYIRWIVERLTLAGALFVAMIAILPEHFRRGFHAPFFFGGTALLIVVGVALDTIGQLESHLIMRRYEGLIKGARIKGRWFNVQ